MSDLSVVQEENLKILRNYALQHFRTLWDEMLKVTNPDLYGHALNRSAGFITSAKRFCSAAGVSEHDIRATINSAEQEVASQFKAP